MIFRLEYENKKGLQARLDITTLGSSVVKEIEGTENPFILSYKGDKSDKSLNFLTSSAEINIYETPEFNIDALKTSSETQIKVDYYIEEEKHWEGFVIPDFFSREIGGAGVVSMSASDRLSTLKGVTLSDLPAMVQIRDLTVRCLAKTGLGLTLKTMADFRSNEFGFNDYFRSEITSQRLYDSKGRSISCYDILKSILVASGSTLRQRGGEWHIINKLQHEAGAGRVYNTENTSVDYVESVHHFDEIIKGARRTIIPVAGSVGIYHEYGGGKLHPDNYDFSQGLTGWTPVGGFVAGIGNQSVNGYKIESGVYVPDYGEPGLNHLKNANPYQRNVNPIYLESAPIVVPYSGSGAVNIEFDLNGVGPMLTTQAVMRIAIVAQKGEELLTLHHGGAFAPMPSDNPPVFEKRFKKGFTNPDFTAGADTQSMRVSGALESSELEGWELRIRIYGGGSSNTILINAASIQMKSSQETPKGAIYKRDQGSDFTKTHDIETAIFADYLTAGKDGYFYDYPIDDTSSIHNPSGGISSLWTTPYFPTETDALPILQHVVRQQARMFSVAHDLISGEIEIERFDPLSIFIDCNGKRYVIVSASFDFLRSNVRVELEEIAYANLTVRDYIYSYFGDGEEGIKSIGGISGAGGSGSGGGLTPEQIEILSFWKKDPDNPNTIFTEMNAYSKLELSAYGVGDGGGGGGGGIIETVYGYGNLGQTFNNANLTDTFNAYTINQINTRLVSVESGSATTVNTTGTGNAITSISKSGSVITANKGLAFSLSNHLHTGVYEPAFSKNTAFNKNFGTTAGTVAEGNHTHTFASLTSKPTTLGEYGITDSFRELRTVTDLDAVTTSGIYRQELPSSGFNYTTTLNLNSSDGRQQLTIDRNGSGMKFRGVNSGSGATGWTSWKEVYHTGNLSPVTLNTAQTITGAKTFSSNLYTTADLTADTGITIAQNEGTGVGLSLFGVAGTNRSTNPDFGLMFARTTNKGTHGSVTGDWATYLTMTATAGRGWIFTTDPVGIGGNVASISNTGNITASGEITAYVASDRRLKENIRPITTALETINKLNPVSYNWNAKAKELNSNKTDKLDYGLIAQEVENVLPGVVHGIFDDKYKSIDYIKLIPILIGAIKELNNEIDKLK